MGKKKLDHLEIDGFRFRSNEFDRRFGIVWDWNCEQDQPLTSKQCHHLVAYQALRDALGE